MDRLGRTPWTAFIDRRNEWGEEVQFISLVPLEADQIHRIDLRMSADGYDDQIVQMIRQALQRLRPIGRDGDRAFSDRILDHIDVIRIALDQKDSVWYHDLMPVEPSPYVIPVEPVRASLGYPVWWLALPEGKRAASKQDVSIHCSWQV